jgi:hypothetical protein
VPMEKPPGETARGGLVRICGQNQLPTTIAQWRQPYVCVCVCVSERVCVLRCRGLELSLDRLPRGPCSA